MDDCDSGMQQAHLVLTIPRALPVHWPASGATTQELPPAAPLGLLSPGWDPTNEALQQGNGASHEKPVR